MPVYNEERYIEACLDSLVAGDFPHENLEILIYDGGSTDRTPEILKGYASRYSFIKLLDNPDKVQVKAVNMGLNEAAGEYIIRCDAHSVYPMDYVSTLVGYLADDDGSTGNVGGQADTVPAEDTARARAIALALAHPFGVGLSHRSLKAEGPVEVDTLLFGCWRREVIKEAGPLNTHFARGEDFEHNLRLRKMGYKVVMLPWLKFSYVGRGRLGHLARMLYQYAYWKVMVAREHRTYPNLRFFVPMVFVCVLTLSLVFQPLRALFALYLGIDAAVSLLAASGKRQAMLFLWMAVVFPVMHVSHGIGALRGIFDVIRGRQASSEGWDVTR